MSKTGMTQIERKAATRRKLLDAATEVLVGEGYTGLTTTRVCRAAGVSQGALFKHFPSKGAMVAALAEDLYAGLAEEFKTAFSRAEGDVIHRGIRHLWAVFSSPRQMASYDLTVAARTDPKLQAALEPIVLKHRERINEMTQTVAALSEMDTDRFHSLADFVLMAVQGAVINSLACPEPEVLETRLAYIESTARKLAGEKEAK
ncbi:MAG: TetR/AcrR family transcriptional regulator [Desulfobacterales bacterium]|nr:TetR/AcrR family transcriptional regulator [Desulfobacterales bacterium]